MKQNNINEKWRLIFLNFLVNMYPVWVLIMKSTSFHPNACISHSEIGWKVNDSESSAGDYILKTHTSNASEQYNWKICCHMCVKSRWKWIKRIIYSNKDIIYNLNKLFKTGPLFVRDAELETAVGLHKYYEINFHLSAEWRKLRKRWDTDKILYAWTKYWGQSRLEAS